MKSQSVREGEQRLISCTRDLMCLGANGIGAKGQCGRNWPGSCSRSMCLMCSDIILVEINYLCWSEEVSREIPWLDMNRCPILQVTFLFVWGLFQFLVCFSCERDHNTQLLLDLADKWHICTMGENCLFCIYSGFPYLMAGHGCLFSMNNIMVMIKFLFGCCHSLSWSFKGFGLNFPYVVSLASTVWSRE